ncbi:ribonuclease P protein component [Prochlorococcus sp. MIT 1223]|uniref:ribonuclease P protein component n=1 Tax=Prochlorococcus sp. MIT 1223 TaxID=3096217 RepID=UPI002A7483E7|nr:ribonuclease P protein component [Prochlorococcus sp. MIT 1223]
MVLTKSLRLSGYKCFDYLHQQGFRFHGKLMTLRTVTPKPILLKKKNRQSQSAQSKFKCAISISHKVSKKAVTRNKLRRLLHDHLRNKISRIKNQPNAWALITLKPSSAPYESHEFLLKECDRLLSKAGLFR